MIVTLTRIDNPRRHRQPPHQPQHPVTSLMTSLNRRRPANMKCRTAGGGRLKSAAGTGRLQWTHCTEKSGFLVVKINESADCGETQRQRAESAR